MSRFFPRLRLDSYRGPTFHSDPGLDPIEVDSNFDSALAYLLPALNSDPGTAPHSDFGNALISDWSRTLF
ncbi:hypothetical protein EVAR_27073_1 [Eumeta japonica]|uniref:Uncharacterized protein n=1 Tax=Eumeta variegata TaxID=151549 RepID=A0A4C1VMI8_EUMVA|nr:hypothetical protein EVAR_27073_1 [Eumeta japonica]